MQYFGWHPGLRKNRKVNQGNGSGKHSIIRCSCDTALTFLWIPKNTLHQIRILSQRSISNFSPLLLIRRASKHPSDERLQNVSYNEVEGYESNKERYEYGWSRKYAGEPRRNEHAKDNTPTGSITFGIKEISATSNHDHKQRNKAHT